MVHTLICVLLLLNTLIYCTHSKDDDQLMASIRVSPQPPFYSGETVRLQCHIPDYSYWTYSWIRDNKYVLRQTSETITIPLPDQAVKYQCIGRWRGLYPFSTQSDTLLVNVTDLPTSEVSVSPHGLLYSRENVTLQCNISDYTDWTYRWYRNKNQLGPGSPLRTITTQSDQVNQYQCQGRRTDRPQSSKLSVSLHINVTANQPNATLSSDQQDILTVDNVTLTCTVESSGWRFYWYRHRQDSEPVATTSGSSYTLSQVSVSDGGQYWCRAGRGDPVYYTQYSEPVHIQVTVTGSSTSVLVGVFVGLVVAGVLLTILLVLMCPDSDSAVARPVDGTYAQIKLKMLDKNTAPVHVTYAEVDFTMLKAKRKAPTESIPSPAEPVYSQLKPVSVNAPVDVTYAEVELKILKARKKGP